MAAFNGIAYTAKFYEPVIEDNVWTGVLDIRTSDYLEATAKDGVSYAQVLASLVPVYFTEVPSSYTLTTTVTVTSGTLALELTDGGVQTYQDISGLTASATISRYSTEHKQGGPASVMDAGPLALFKAQRIGDRRQSLKASPSREPDPQRERTQQSFRCLQSRRRAPPRESTHPAELPCPQPAASGSSGR